MKPDDDRRSTGPSGRLWIQGKTLSGRSPRSAYYVGFVRETRA